MVYHSVLGEVGGGVERIERRSETGRGEGHLREEKEWREERGEERGGEVKKKRRGEGGGPGEIREREEREKEEKQEGECTSDSIGLEVRAEMGV